MDNNISRAFNKFAGREIPMTKEVHEFRGKKYESVRIEDENHPTLVEMRELAESMGLKLRLWTPDSMGTMDYRLDRLNAHVVEDPTGKFVISSKFDLG